MLQPKSYQLDCMDHLGKIIPHENHRPVFNSVLLDELWFEAYGSRLSDELGEAPDALFRHVDWWMGMDSVRAIHSDFLENVQRIVEGELDCRSSLSERS